MATSGTLVTRVFTGRGELPIAGATISIVRRDAGGQMDLLSVQISDPPPGPEPVPGDRIPLRRGGRVGGPAGL